MEVRTDQASDSALSGLQPVPLVMDCSEKNQLNQTWTTLKNTCDWQLLNLMFTHRWWRAEWWRWRLGALLDSWWSVLLSLLLWTDFLQRWSAAVQSEALCVWCSHWTEIIFTADTLTYQYFPGHFQSVLTNHKSHWDTWAERQVTDWTVSMMSSCVIVTIYMEPHWRIKVDNMRVMSNIWLAGHRLSC